MENCIICKLVKGEFDVTKVYEDDKVMAFMDIQPINIGHVLVSPKCHCSLVTELDEEIGAHLFRVGMKIDKALRESGIRCDGVNFFIADGRAAMQEIPHVHLHVIPRFEGDGFGFKFPKDYFEKPSRDELKKTASMIKGALD